MASPDAQPAEITRRRTVAAPPDAVWQVLVDFGALSAWAGNVTHSEVLHAGPDGLSGTSRRVQVGRLALVETVIEAVPGQTLTYRIEGLPRALGALSNSWALRKQGTGTEVSLTSAADGGAGPVGRLRARLGVFLLSRQSDSMLSGLDEHVRSRP